jgi:hypothetical protein
MNIRNSQKFLAFYFTLFGVSFTVRAEPRCKPTEISNKYFNWHSCDSNYDDHSWYGISKMNFTSEEGRRQCAAYGGSLIVVNSSEIDHCAYNAMLEEQRFNEFVLFSGYYKIEEKKLVLVS